MRGPSPRFRPSWGVPVTGRRNVAQKAFVARNDRAQTVDMAPGWRFDGGGLVYIDTVSAPAGSTEISFTSKFSSAFDEYVIYLLLECTLADRILYARLKSGNTANSTAGSYYSSAVEVNSQGGGAITGVASGASEPGRVGGVRQGGGRGLTTVTVANPMQAEITQVRFEQQSYQSAGGGRYHSGGFSHVISSAFDGITFFPSGGTISGVGRVYGVRKV